MNNDSARAVIRRAHELQRLELAAAALPRTAAPDLRALWAALLAALISLIPSISAAQTLI